MMTRINLLPREYRKKGMTPLRVFLPAMAGLAFLVGTAFFWGWIHFAALAEAKARKDSLQGSYNSKKPTLEYLARLGKEEGEYRKRADTIKTIASSRTLWSRKLDQLCAVVVDDDGGDRYLIRLDELTVKAPKKQARRRRIKGPPPGEIINLNGYCFNDDDPLEHFNNFHEALKQSAFFMGDGLSISKPEGQVETPDQGLHPALAWSMNIDVVMKGKAVPKPSRKLRRPAVRASAK